MYYAVFLFFPLVNCSSSYPLTGESATLAAVGDSIGCTVHCFGVLWNFHDVCVHLLQDLAAAYPLNAAPATLAAVGDSIGRAAGGTSGGLYHVLFAAAAASLAR